MKRASLIIIGLACVASVRAQSIAPVVIASSGTDFSNATAQLSWTIGEPVVATFDNGSNILTQGFHQTMLEVTGISEPRQTLQGISVYPNPSSYVLNISLSGQQGNLTLEMFDAAGKMVLADHLDSGSSTHTTDMTGLANGPYILRLTSEAGLQRTFNIQKVQPK